MSETNGSGEPSHKQLQLAHERYFQDISQAWAETQSRIQSVQTDYERALAKACQSQQPSEFQTVQDEYQRAFQAVCNDANPAQSYAEAYRKYKAALQSAIASADLDELHFTDMARLSQSLYAVSQMAMCLMPCDPAAANNPFQADKPSDPPPA
jgi:hypothetical protein